MKGHLGCRLGIQFVGVMIIIEVATFDGDNGFIKGNPAVDQVPKVFKTEAGIGLIGIYDGPIFPTLDFLQFKGQIKVVEIDHQLNPLVLNQPKDLSVEGKSCLVDLPNPLREEAGPLDGGPKDGMPCF